MQIRTLQEIRGIVAQHTCLLDTTPLPVAPTPLQMESLFTRPLLAYRRPLCLLLVSTMIRITSATLMWVPRRVP